jgi:hypothetical protein
VGLFLALAALALAASACLPGPARTPEGPAAYLGYRAANLTRVLDLPESPDIIPRPDGNFNIRYTDRQGVSREWVYEPRNKVIGSVEVSATPDPDAQLWIYRYSVCVADDSPQSAWLFGVSYEGTKLAETRSPEGWRPSTRVMGRPVLTWGDAVSGRHGIAPGQAERGFELRSASGPGPVRFYIEGYTDIPSFPYGEAPADPRPKFFGDAAVGETIGPVPESVASAQLIAPTDWVGLREVLEPAGWTISWEPTTMLARARGPAGEIQGQAGNGAAEVNGRPLVLSAQPRLRDDAMEIPRADAARLLAAASS